MSITADEFVRLVAASMPSRESLLAYGLGEEEIVDVQRLFLCPPIPGAREGTYAHVLEELVVRYDCSSLELPGSLTFIASLPFPRVADGTIVGRWEADPILVLDSGEVVVIDHAFVDQDLALRTELTEGG